MPTVWSINDVLDLPAVRNSPTNQAKVERLAPRVVTDHGANVEPEKASQFLAETPRLSPNITLKPEELLQHRIVRALRPRLHEIGGEIFAMNGERQGGRGGKEWRFQRAQMVMGAMGYIPGTPDLWLACPPMFYRRQWPFGVMEVKVPGGEPAIVKRGDAFAVGKSARGELQTEQRVFRDWCHGNGLPWACARSVEEAMAALKEWEWIQA